MTKHFPRAATTFGVVRMVSLLSAAVLLVGCTDSPSAQGPATVDPTGTALVLPSGGVVPSGPPAVMPGEAGAPNVTLDPSVAATMFDIHEKNDSDVEFATMMIPHHQQAVRLTGLVAGRTQNKDVIDMAGRMDAEQSAEITVFKSWLVDQKQPELAGDDLAEHVMHMAGSISEDQFTEIEAASGTAFDRLFYTRMIAHHEGAMEMADATLGAGINPDMHRMAADVNVTQNAQVRQMEALLSALGR